MDWQPANTAPQRTRVLVSSAGGHIQIARRAPIRWYDDKDGMISPPAWWAPLPDAPAEPPKPPPRARKVRKPR